MLLVVGVAVWRGGLWERKAANAMLVAWLFTKLVYRYQGQQTEWGILAVDVGLLALLVWIALRSDRFWPIFAAAFHLLALVTHGARMIDPKVLGWAYITAGIIWSYLAVAAVGYGAWTARAGVGRDVPRVPRQ